MKIGAKWAYAKLYEVQFRTIDAAPKELPPKRQRKPQQRTQPEMPSFDDMERDLF